MAKLRINGDSSGYVDLEAPNAASSSTLDLDQVPQKNAATKFDTVLQVGSSSTITNAYGAPYGYVFDVKANSGTQSYMSIGTPSDTTGSGGLVMGVDGSAVRITSRDDKRQIFSTNNIERMTIHSTTSGDGAVTMPHQPGFQFWNNGSDFAISAGGKVTCFYAGDHNIGSHFDASNQRFTAPVSGYYLFGGHLRIGAPGKIRVARFQIYLNGSRRRDLMSVGGTNDYDGSSGYDHPGASGTAVQYLNTGDYVEMYVDAELSSSNTVYIQGGSNSNRKSYWFGHLLG